MYVSFSANILFTITEGSAVNYSILCNESAKP